MAQKFDWLTDLILPGLAVAETVVTKGKGKTALGILGNVDAKRAGEEERRVLALERAAQNKRDDELLGLNKARAGREEEEFTTKKTQRQKAIERFLSLPDLSEADKADIEVDPYEWQKRGPDRILNQASTDPEVTDLVNRIKDATSYNKAKSFLLGKYGATVANKVLGGGAKTEMPMSKFSIYEGAAPGGQMGGWVVGPDGIARPIKAGGSAAPPAPAHGGHSATATPPAGAPQLSRSGGLTKGQEAIDRNFAKEYEEYAASGGFADAQKGLTQLREMTEKVKAGGNLSGPIIGMLGDRGQALFNPEALDVREQIEEVVQRNLKSILGAQFAQVEGQQLIKRAYNPSLKEEQNAKRLDRLVAQMEQALTAKEAAARYFEQNGTLKGFESKLYRSAADFDFGDEKKPITPADAVKAAFPGQPAAPTTSEPDGTTKVNKQGVKMVKVNGKWQIAQQ